MVEVSCDLKVAFDRGQGHLVGDGQRLVFRVDEPTTLAGLGGRRSLRALSTELTRAGLTLDVRSGDDLLLTAGREARAGILERLLRLPRVRVNPRFALRSAWRRGRPRLP